MQIRPEVSVVVLLSVILGIIISPTRSWGQASADERIGTVLAVDGTAEVQAANTRTWEPLQFRAAIFQNDIMRTGAESKVKVLLRDDTIMTLAERSEMQFTEFLLTPQQRRTVVSLALGKLRVVTTKIFGAGSATEVRTANTVAGVRGTSFVVIFNPPARTQVLTLEGVVSVRNANPNVTRSEPVPQNFRTEVQGDSEPAGATALSPAERQAIEQDLRLTEQVPTEVKTTSERQAAAGPIRGEETTLAPLDASGSSTSRSGSLSSGIIASRTALQLGAQPNLEAKVMQQALQSRQSPLSPSVTPQPEQILSNIQTTSQVTSTMPSNTSAPITSDTSPPAKTVITQQATKLNLTIRIPR